MLEEYGIPTWAAYLMFGVATIIIGLILGLVRRNTNLYAYHPKKTFSFNLMYL